MTHNGHVSLECSSPAQIQHLGLSSRLPTRISIYWGSCICLYDPQLTGTIHCLRRGGTPTFCIVSPRFFQPDSHIRSWYLCCSAGVQLSTGDIYAHGHTSRARLSWGTVLGLETLEGRRGQGQGEQYHIASKRRAPRNWPACQAGQPVRHHCQSAKERYGKCPSSA